MLLLLKKIIIVMHTHTPVGSTLCCLYIYLEPSLGLDNVSQGTSLEKTNFHSISHHLQPVVLQQRVRSCEISPINIDMLTGDVIVQVSFR